MAVHACMINGTYKDLELSEVTPCVLNNTAQIDPLPEEIYASHIGHNKGRGRLSILEFFRGEILPTLLKAVA